MGRKTYIGYDLGDGETITDLVTLEQGKATSKTDFNDMTMPDTVHAGKAMPSIFAFDENGEVIFSKTIAAEPEAVKHINVNFKRRPTDLLRDPGAMATLENLAFLKEATAWPNASVWPQGNTPEMLNFKNSVIAFTNAIFENQHFANRVKSAAQNSDEIVFCVGHPTNWSELDIAIYGLIFKSTILGTGKYAGFKSSILMEKESRAAFLYSKDVDAFEQLPKGSSVLLIDVGSSTIDLTAMTATSNNNQYNNGSNYLGARSIDFMIRAWYLEKLRQQPAFWQMYQSMVKNNPSLPNALTLSCRVAKEELYSSTAGRATINFAIFPGIRLNAKELDEIINQTPIGPILQENIQMNPQDCARMGDRTWKQLFREFLTEQKAAMEKQGIRVGCIILTGSASRMVFVPQIVMEVFQEVSAESIKYDMDPSRTISKGLALVGPSEEKSKAFERDVSHLIDRKLEQIVANNIPTLATDMGKVISDILIPKMKRHIRNWRNEDIKTLDEMNEKIKADCSEENLTQLLTSDPRYKKAIENWLKNSVGKDIAVELKGICNKYNVHDISIEDLNVMTLPKISIGELPLDPLEFMDTVSVVIALIAGVISAASIATIMALVVVALAFISETLAAYLFIALAGMGPVGWGILAAVVGISVAALIAGGLDSFKNSFQKLVMGWDLPKLARNTMTDAQIDEAFQKADLASQIQTAFADQELKNEIVSRVSVNLKGQIQKRAEDIKYAIQSR